LRKFTLEFEEMKWTGPFYTDFNPVVFGEIITCCY